MWRKLCFERLEDRRVLSADFNGDQSVDGDDLDIWKDEFGTINPAAPWHGDSDGDMDVDGNDFLQWQRQVSQFIPDAPRGVEARALGPTSGEVTWEPSVGATSYAVARRQPDTEVAYTIIAPNVIGTSFMDSGLASDTLYEYVVIAQVNPQSVPSTPAHFTTNQGNLTAYRPQGVHRPFLFPADEPIYDPFPKRAVRQQDEFSNTLGPGIRINYDDDDNNGFLDAYETGTEIARENDLIEVKVDRLPGQGDLVLVAQNPLSLFLDYDKERSVPLNDDLTATDPLAFVNDTITVFVEWTGVTHGFANLSLVDLATSTTLDTVRFHTFHTLIVAFGGRGDNPRDTDGDGWIGDPSGGAATNREGIFDIAQGFYNNGWDVLAFDEAEIDLPSFTDPSQSIPYQEILTGYNFRSLDAHAVIGYSQGGGAAHDITEALYANEELVTRMVVYLDAVQQDFWNPQTDWPEVTFYMLNIYEEIDEGFDLGGGDINDNEPDAWGASMDEINTTTNSEYNNTLDHFSIDDDPAIQQLIINQLYFWLGSR